MSEDFKINKKVIAPGEYEVVRLNVAKLPSDTVITIRVHVYRSKNPGPTIMAIGGVHGDEINGVEIVRKMIHDEEFKNLNRGTVIAIPVLNIYGFINFSRETIEGKDVNRNFPGNTNGSLASRVAGMLTKNVLPLVDYAVDFHTGGGSRYNQPQVRFNEEDEKSEELAKVFAAPYLIRKSSPDNSLRNTATKMGIPLLTYEGGEALRYDGPSIEHGVAGFKRILKHHGMIDKAPDVLKKPIVFNKSTWLRASESGMFMWTQSSGSKVSNDEPLGVISDPYGNFSARVLSTKNGYIIGHNNSPVVSQGTALFHIGYSVEEE